MKKPLYLLICFFVFTALLHAQTAAELEEMLGISALNYGQAASFVLRAANVLESSNREEAFRYAAEKNWLPRNVRPETKASLEGVSMLIMESFEFKGGLFYRVFKNPHYAYRELNYLEVIQGRTDPEMDVSGDLLLFIIGRALSLTDELMLPVRFTVPDPGDNVTMEIPDMEIPDMVIPDMVIPYAENPDDAAPDVSVTVVISDISVPDTGAGLVTTGGSGPVEIPIESPYVENIAGVDPDDSVTVEIPEIEVSFLNIQFLPDSAVLLESEKEKLREIALVLSTVRQRNILVTGHTAHAKTEAGRMQLSRERAQIVADYLVSLGARTMDEITVIGYGAARPIADNRTAEGMAQNRRAEIAILSDLGFIPDILFLPDSVVLQESEKAKLREIAQTLSTVSQRRILLAGYTADAGTVFDRVMFSLNRAQAVKEFMVSIGARTADEIEIIGYGSDRAIADNSTTEGLAQNRRVEIIILES